MACCFRSDGKNLVFTSEVYPECGADDACNKKNLDADAASKVKARIYTELLYRHWTAWQSRRRSHLLVVPVSGGAAKDLTPGNRDVPPFSLGGPDDYDISPDGKEVCYSENAGPGACHQHQSRPLRGLYRRWRAAQDHLQSGRRCQPAIFARRQVPRLARAVPRRV